MNSEEKIRTLNNLLKKLKINDRSEAELQKIVDGAVDLIVKTKESFNSIVNQKNRSKSDLLRVKITNKEIEPYLKKFCSIEFIEFIKKNSHNPREKAEKVCYTLKQVGRDKKKFINPKENFKNVYERKLDFYSVCLGFEGYLDAEECDFDIEKKNIQSQIDKEQKQESKENISKYSRQKLEQFILEIKDMLDNHIVEVNDSVSKVIKEYDEQVLISKLEDIKKDVINGDEAIFSELFDSILSNKKLDNVLCIKIEEYIKDDTKYYYRALIASALSLSIIKGWDENKLDLLKKLVLLRNEPLVKERAIIGIVLSLVVSYRTDNFENTLRHIEVLKENIKLKAGIYEGVYFILEEDMIPIGYRSELNTKIIQKTYQLFEPIHSKVTNIDLDFEVCDTDNNFYECVGTSYKNALKEFSFLINHFGELRQYNTKLNEHIKILKRNHFVRCIFSKLPYPKYANLLEYSTIKKYEYKEKISLLKEFGNQLINVAEIGKTEEIYQKAIHKFSLYREIETNDYQAISRAGFCFLQIANLKDKIPFLLKSIDEFEKALKINPNHIFSILMLLTCFYKIQKKDSKNTLVKRKIKYYSTEIIRIEQETDDFLNYTNHFEKGIIQNTRSVDIIYQIGRAYLISKSIYRAERFFNISINLLYNLVSNPLWSVSSSSKLKLDESFFESEPNSNELKYILIGIGHCGIIVANVKQALFCYKKSLYLWNNDEEFFNNFDNDFQYIEPQGVSKEDYEGIKKELEEYCVNKK